MLEVNLRNRAVTQHTMDLNSMCLFGGEVLAASSSGLFRMDGYTDSGAQIPALIKSGDMDFGSVGKKRFRFFYFGLQATGPLKLKIYCDGVLAEEYRVAGEKTGARTIRVPISRRHAGRYWSWSIENVNGAFFALYSVKGIPVTLHPNMDQ